MSVPKGEHFMTSIAKRNSRYQRKPFNAVWRNRRPPTPEPDDEDEFDDPGAMWDA